LKFKEL